ncbi:hypothetical protein [Nocardioides sp. SYSU DS0651]|uniref:hypothetical protein n=1 Tax=Nocardioides sp. SYSU DS0651 TaxID=3415955 RepID=UPI003F4C15DC
MSPWTARPLRVLLGTTTGAALLAAGLVAAPNPAVGAPGDDPACPAAYPAADLALGQQVTGATTAGSYRRAGVEHDSRVTPEAFSGFYRGTIEDPAGDLLVFELEGSRITRPDGTVDAGVWSGISGSPLYAADGRLVGAVSYSFGSNQASVFAGVTPAADLYDLLEPAAPAAEPTRIVPGESELRMLARQGMPSATASAGAVRLSPETQVAGLGSRLEERMLRAIARKAGVALPRAVGGGGSQAEPIEIVPGGNVAAAHSHGSLALYSVGTAAAVCDGVVIGYGHADQWSPAPRTIHGASTVFVQEDGAWSFKITNLGAPVGELLHDRLNGITGRLGPLPDSASVGVTTQGPKPRSTSSEVVDPEALPYLVANQAYRDAVLTLDESAGGEATVAWSIDYLRADGTPGTFSRSQRYASRYAVAEEVPSDVAGDLETILANPFEQVTVTGVSVHQDVSRVYRAYELGRVEVRRGHRWVRVRDRQRLVVRPGSVLKVRVNLRSAQGATGLAPRSKAFWVRVPRGAMGNGELVVHGHGGSFWDDPEEWYDEEDEGWEIADTPEPRTFDEMLQALASEPRQDRVEVTATIPARTRLVVRSSTWDASAVVSGSHSLRLAYRR